MNDPTIVAAVIAAAVALFVSLLGSIFTLFNEILGHRLTQRREAQKYYDEVYKELFAPIISDVFLYVDMASIPMEAPPEERQIEIKDKAIDFIKSQLVYASPKLISSYHRINSMAIADERGQNPTEAELHFLHDFVEEYIQVIRKTSIFSRRESRNQISAIVERLILYLLHKEGLTRLAHYSYQFSPGSFTEAKYRKVRSLITRYELATEKLYDEYERQRKHHERLLSAKGESERIKELNDITSGLFEKAGNERRNLERQLVKSIVYQMISKDDERKDITKWIIEEQDYQDMLATSPNSE